MSYVAKTLTPDEQIKDRAELHWVNYTLPSVLIIVALLAIAMYLFNAESYWYTKYVAIFFAVWASYAFLKVHTIEMVITNKRVVFRKGIMAIKTEELKISKIESIEVKQSILGRIFGYADICFSGIGSSEVKFPSVQDPWNIKARMESATD